MTEAEIVDAVRAGDRRAIARALSVVERQPGGTLAAALYRHSGRAHVVGLTGPPGAGKSSLLAGLAQVWRAAGRTVGVVAVDPSSPYSGGALLGDRLRLAALHGDGGVFIRSLASRGQAGGLAQAAADAVRVLDAAGFDLVALETVGAGQAEVAVADECHTTVLVLTPAAGDDLQALKAGILETADLIVVNKADLPGAAAMVAHLQGTLALGGEPLEPGWLPPVLQTVASQAEGLTEAAAAVDRHEAYLRAGPGWAARERRRAEAELTRQLVAHLVTPLLAAARPGAADAAVVDALVARETDPRAAVGRLLARRPVPAS